MDLILFLLMLAAIIAICVFVVKLLFGPMKFILKLLVNAAFGFVILFIVNFVG